MADVIFERRCATEDLSTGDWARMRDLERRFKTEAAALIETSEIHIPINFIHFTDGSEGVIPKGMRDEQVDVLNAKFSKWRVRFSEAGHQTVDDAEAFRMGHRSLAERKAKTAWQKLNPNDGLNFYTAGPVGGLLGWATFPHHLAGDTVMDGVVLLHSTLPGGAQTGYDLGITGVHEVGHWLGLYHTFQGGCSPTGDEVADTPSHSGPNYGTPDPTLPWNACIPGTKAPVRNYMNYTDDAHMTEFTKGQRDRIWAQTMMFRPKLISGTAKTGGSRNMQPAVIW